MHQAGTHYIKHIIACAIADKYEIPDPEFNHANDIFGGPKDEVVYRDIPRLISSHSYPNPLLLSKLVHELFNLPSYVLLVRDLRHSLISNYAKWSHVYEVPFSSYLRGEMHSKRFNSDIWWTIGFLNGWGLVYKRIPNKFMILKYEDLLEHPLAQVSQLNNYWALKLSQQNIEYGIAQSTKEKMKLKDDPNRPKGAVRNSSSDLSVFTATDKKFIELVCDSYLSFSAGYDYSKW
tara:strand:- start:185 stop:886 length:702 start_codon:yes stop_codon:yes gene_type:complete